MSTELKPALPTDSAERKNIPLARGVLDYFPAALAEVARLSQSGNDKHNPGEELHWARGKSMDHADCIIRHVMDRGTIDPEDGKRHTVKAAWRVLAMLQEELEAAGLATMPRGARLAPTLPPAPRAWHEGWVCECGSTEVYSLYSREEVEAKIKAHTGPYCNRYDCFLPMTRRAACAAWPVERRCNYDRALGKLSDGGFMGHTCR